MRIVSTENRMIRRWFENTLYEFKQKIDYNLNLKYNTADKENKIGT